jgi:DNA-directed RNA polymerase alpha subunit
MTKSQITKLDILVYSLFRIKVLRLSSRIYNCLKRSNIYTLGDLLLAIGNPDDLLQIDGLGKEDIEKIYRKLDNFNQNYFDEN